MLRTLTLAHGWAKAFNGTHFIVKLSNSRNVLNTALNVKYRIVVRALVFYPWDRMAATAQHHKARAYYVLLIQEKIKIQNLKSGLYLRHSTFTLFKAKKKKKSTSLGVPRLGIRLPMQGSRVQPLLQEDPTCWVATEPALLSLGSITGEATAVRSLCITRE